MKTKKKEYWWASEVELDEMEKLVFRTMLSRAIGIKRMEELKEMGDVKAVKGGLTVNLDIGRNKRLAMFFGRRYNAYEYRSELFFKRKEEVLK